MTSSLTLVIGNRNYSSWSLRPWVFLRHFAVPFEEVRLALDTPEFSRDIARWSPSARVPVLHHDGMVIWDSLAICEYVHELHPAAALWPRDAAARARARAVSAEMHSSFAALRRDMPMDLCARKPGHGHSPDALADAARVQAIWREAISASGGPFLFGAFTIADAMFAPVATRFRTYGVPLDAVTQAYVDTIYALPAMVTWLRDAAAEPQTRG